MRLIQGIFFLGMGLQLSACGVLKPYFPDKEKDYQLIREIPALVVPDDLTTQPVLSVTSTKNETTTQPVLSTKRSSSSIIRLISHQGVDSITIENNLAQVWRLVGRALSRHSIEITDRNEKKNIFIVQYDADFEKVEDGSLWDEVIFIFAEDPAKEKEYQIKLRQVDHLIEVTVIGSDESLQTNKLELTLLELLYNTIKEELSVQ